MTSPRAVRSLLALLALLALPASPALAAWPHDPSGPGLPLRPDQLVAFTPSVCEDGTGGYFVAWDENNVIFVQHVNAAGRLLWGSGAVAVASLPSSRFYPAICPDGSGGAIVAWQDNRAGNPDVYAQRVNAAGAEQWTLNGVALCSATGTQSGVRIAADGAGAAVVVWLDTRSGFTRVFARGVSAAGVPQWAEDGVEVTPGTWGDFRDRIRAGEVQLAVYSWSASFPDAYDYVSGWMCEPVSATSTRSCSLRTERSSPRAGSPSARPRGISRPPGCARMRAAVSRSPGWTSGERMPTSTRSG